ncbi:Uncharacterized protein FWK35_00011957, partial [Aphis craccivora]
VIPILRAIRVSYVYSDKQLSPQTNPVVSLTTIFMVCKQEQFELLYCCGSAGLSNDQIGRGREGWRTAEVIKCSI